MSASEFYLACRNGDVAKVEQLLPHLTLEDVDRFEPNGSTALHAASYYEHADIVRLLLEKGACRRQENKYGNTPADEAKTLEIAKLFNREAVSTNSRFVAESASREWSIKSEFDAASHHRRFYSFTQRPPISTLVKQILDAKELRDAAGMDQIARWTRKAVRKDDTTFLVRSYTAQTDFYKRLNATLADLKDLTNKDASEPSWSCALARYLASDPALRKKRWEGITYRGMHMTDKDIAAYQVGQMLMNKSFLSTSRLREVAEDFARKKLPSGKRAAICTYIINDDHVALDIQEYSEYPPEEEVLILPCMDFEVTKVDMDGEFIEIEVLLR